MLHSASAEQPFDLAVIGGGVNGCGIARDAAGRGVSVALFEQDDLASGTSSASTKLIHGGLRYLEHYEFRLVREALAEREVLWRAAPHVIRPLRFVLPHHSGLRPRWLLRLGLLLYDNLGGRKLLPATRSLDLTGSELGRPLKESFTRGFEYSDCWVDDARLVVLNARDAADRGAAILPRTKVVGAARDGDLWRIRTQGAEGGCEEFAARALVNAAGPWVGDVIGSIDGTPAPASIRLVQGSHIVVPRLFDHDRAYIFQNADGRVVFAIPFERDFTLLGTTDRDYRGDPSQIRAGDEEIAYLCAAASDYFRVPVLPAEVVWTYSGVRPLYDDGASRAQEATRDYVLSLDVGPGRPALLNIFGGKITTYRRLAEAAMNKLAPHLPAIYGPAWTQAAPLPGGDFPHDGLADLVTKLCAEHPWLASPQAERLARAYGTRAFALLEGARGADDLGDVFGADLSEREVAYLMASEWAMGAEDVLWRRSKLGLRFTPDQVRRLEDFMIRRRSVAASSAESGRRRRAALAPVAFSSPT